MKRLIIIAIIALSAIQVHAQVGEYRSVFSIGAGGGYVLNKIGFQPTVTQNMHGGATGGLTFRYTCEKYFSTLCAVQAEFNITQLGWKEDIKTINRDDVINPETGITESYSRDQTYIQIPVFAHLSWGKERKGVNAFINIGPQLGINIGEKTTKNYNSPYTDTNFPDTYNSEEGRSSSIEKQETMPIENKLDYGIVAGAGIEVHINKVGRFNLEGRYYYGLGNIYGDSKRDYFGVSNHTSIFIKMSYLHDI